MAWSAFERLRMRLTGHNAGAWFDKLTMGEVAGCMITTSVAEPGSLQ